MNIFYQTHVPVNQNFLYQTEDAAKNAATGELDIQCDENTGFIYNKAFDASLVNYSGGYDNNQHYSSFFSDYIDNQIKWLVKNYIHRNATVVEVGCGKGYYIRKIAQKLPHCRVMKQILRISFFIGNIMMVNILACVLMWSFAGML
jgi:hypothetical protein